MVGDSGVTNLFQFAVAGLAANEPTDHLVIHRIEIRRLGVGDEPAFMQHLVSAHQSGRRDYSALLWTVMMFDAFLRKAQD